MIVGIIGAGKIGTALGNLASRFAEVRYIDKREPYGKDYSILQNTDINFICVNTTSDDCYDMTNVIDCLRSCLAEGLKNLVIASTCPPLFFDTEIYQECYHLLTYSPLFIRQGTIEQDILNAEFILIGSNGAQSPILIDFYTKLNPSYRFVQLGCKEAAVVKMGINGFLTTKIAFANMLGDFCVSEGLDADAVLSAIAGSRSVNPHYFKYGFGYGGPCLPIDNITLATAIGNELPLHVDQENLRHLKFMVKDFCERNPVGPVYVFTDIGYKTGVPIITKSQKLLMAVKLVEHGHKIMIRDSKIICQLVREEHPDKFLFEELE